MNYKEQYFKNLGLDKCDALFCIVCGRFAKNLHHVTYKSRGGTDEPENLVPLCFECHSGHHDRNNPTTEEIIKCKS